MEKQRPPSQTVQKSSKKNLSENIRKFREEFKTKISVNMHNDGSPKKNEERKDALRGVKTEEDIIKTPNSINMPLQFKSHILASTKEENLKFYLKTMQDEDNAPITSNRNQNRFEAVNTEIKNLENNFVKTGNYTLSKMIENPFQEDVMKFISSSQELFGHNMHCLETSLKPRKGDVTPKSSNSVNESERDVNLQAEEKTNYTKEKEPVCVKEEIHQFSYKPFLAKDDLKCSIELVSKECISNRSVTTANPKYIVKSINTKNSLKIGKNSHFLERMYFDNFKRQTKEERLKSFVKDKNPRKNESAITKTFNRLIDDANRRLESTKNLDCIKRTISTEKKPGKAQDDGKRMEGYYTNSVRNFSENKKKKITEKREEKVKSEKMKEEQLLIQLNTKRVSKQEADKIFSRMHEKTTGNRIDSKSQLKIKTVQSKNILTDEKKKNLTIVKVEKNKTSLLKTKSLMSPSSIKSEKEKILFKTFEAPNETRYCPQQMSSSRNNVKINVLNVISKKHINDMQASKIVNNIFQKRL